MIGKGTLLYSVVSHPSAGGLKPLVIKTTEVMDDGEPTKFLGNIVHEVYEFYEDVPEMGKGQHFKKPEELEELHEDLRKAQAELYIKETKFKSDIIRVKESEIKELQEDIAELDRKYGHLKDELPSEFL